MNPGSLHRSLPSAAAGPAVQGTGGVTGDSPVLSGEHTDRISPADPVVVVVLADIQPSSRLWGYGRFVFGRGTVRRQPGVRFAKVLGSGFEGGFGLKPSASRQGLLCAFDDSATACDFLDRSALVQAYRDHAREYLEVRLRPFSCRGSWDGVRFEPVASPPQAGPVAGLTRASIRPRHAQPLSDSRLNVPPLCFRAACCTLRVILGIGIVDMNHDAIRAKKHDGG